MKNIVLIGMPGSGKTSFGKRTAKELNMRFFDTDSMIVAREGMSVSELFARKGEAYFRDRETEAIEELASLCAEAGQGGIMVSVGGGAVERDRNVEAMRRIGFVIFLDCSLYDIGKNVRYNADRPLLSDRSKLAALYKKRKPIYMNAAARVLKNKGSYPEALSRLLSMICLLGISADYCVIGDPIAHSLSPLLHGTAFARLGEDAVYRAVRVKPIYLAEAMQDVRSGRLRGLNVTAPHKFSIVRHVDELRGDAVHSRAVNTIVKENGKLIGFNTDMEGLLLALRREGFTYEDHNIVLLGTGGAAAGIVHKAVSTGAKTITIIGRNIRKARTLARTAREHMAKLPNAAPKPKIRLIVHDFGTHSETVRDSDRRDGKMISALAGADILINAMSLGMEGISEGFTDFDFLDALPKGALVYDLVYKPNETELLAAARTRGLAVANGLGMLVYQGILADELFFDRKIDREALFETIYAKLHNAV
ncbi:MAG: hypothetical protein LBQ21_05330 [Clostridiales Family XIII bacterium]|nr:hypothetical protein [Clostridiales Family XIII bacterium]